MNINNIDEILEKFAHLETAWKQLADVIIDDGVDVAAAYPFAESMDEIDVAGWCQTQSELLHNLSDPGCDACKNVPFSLLGECQACGRTGRPRVINCDE